MNKVYDGKFTPYGKVFDVGGENGIPDEWIAQILRCDWIEDLCSQVVLEN